MADSDSSDSSPSCLDPNDDSVPNVGSDCESVIYQQDIGPYKFEPYLSEDSENNEESSANASEAPSEVDTDIPYESRTQNTEWCLCDNCVPMETVVECRCCREVPQVWAKVEELGGDCSCIIKHPGFQTGCLDRYTLEIAYLQYRQDHGHYDANSHSQMRYTAYRQLVRWCWGYLGKHFRVPLPSCAVKAIREAWPSDNELYAGFKFLRIE